MNKYTGWMLTDAKNKVGCPRCGVVPGKPCRRPSGRRATEVHIERLIKFHKDFPALNYAHHNHM